MIPAEMLRALMRLISECPGSETLLIIADRLEQAATELAAGGEDATDLRNCAVLARAQSAALKEPK